MPAVSPASDPNFATNKVHGERAQLELLRQVVKLCKNKRVAVDVGAHIGLWSRNLAPHFEAVFAFEPVRENAECFRHNTRGLENVHLAEIVLGDTTGTAAMGLPDGGNSGMWHVVPGIEIGPKTMHALDTANLAQLDLLKIDTEGFEGRVIRGALQTIRKYGPVIVFEDNGLGAKYFGAEWVNPIPLLKSIGYKLRFDWRKDQVWLPR